MNLTGFLTTVKAIVGAIGAAERELGELPGAEKRKVAVEKIMNVTDAAEIISVIAIDAGKQIEDVVGETVDETVATMNQKGLLPKPGPKDWQ